MHVEHQLARAPCGETVGRRVGEQGWIGVETWCWSTGPETRVRFVADSTALRIVLWPMWQLEVLVGGGTPILVNEL